MGEPNIDLRSNELYEQRGCRDGRADRDCLDAEREIHGDEPFNPEITNGRPVEGTSREVGDNTGNDALRDLPATERRLPRTFEDFG